MVDCPQSTNSPMSLELLFSWVLPSFLTMMRSSLSVEARTSLCRSDDRPTKESRRRRFGRCIQRRRSFVTCFPTFSIANGTERIRSSVMRDQPEALHLDQDRQLVQASAKPAPG